MAKLLVTGGAGFIGSNFIRFSTRSRPQDSIVNLDLLTHAGSKDHLMDGAKSRVRFVKGDIGNSKLVQTLMKGADGVIHFAAETHVDRSILDSQIFLKTNVLGTQTLLEAARKNKIRRFIFISTDEVYGSVAWGSSREDAPLRPNSPYSASKASADLLCRAYFMTHGLPVIITRSCNNYGPWQFPEKVIPLFITNMIEGKSVPLYGKGENVREWIHVNDHARAIERVFEKGEPGEIYNIGSGFEINNDDLAKKLVNAFGKGEESIQRVQDRPGHDLRYSLNSAKIRSLGWKPEIRFEVGIKETIDWYQANRGWWEKIKGNRRYRSYIKKQYAERVK